MVEGTSLPLQFKRSVGVEDLLIIHLEDCRSYKDRIYSIPLPPCFFSISPPFVARASHYREDVGLFLFVLNDLPPLR